MLKRVLVTFDSLSEVDYLTAYAELIKKTFDVEIFGIYIKDIRKYEVVPPMAEGMIIDSTNGFAMREWELIEEKRAQEIKGYFIDKIPTANFLIEDGISAESIVNKMKGFDLLIAAKGEYISSNLKSILKFHVKPVIIVPKLDKYSFENFLLLEDFGIRANGALAQFVNIIPNVKKMGTLTIGREIEVDKIVNEYYRSKNLEVFSDFEDNLENIYKFEKSYDLFIMGNLRYNFLLEKLTGKFGVKILEQCKVPIFIA